MIPAPTGQEFSALAEEYPIARGRQEAPRERMATQTPLGRRGVTARVRRAWLRTAARLLPLGGTSDGNQLTLFVNGDDAFHAMLAAIEHARTAIWLETYIFEPDALGLRVLAALTAAAARGVSVVLLVDAVGSGNLDDEHLAPLEQEGGRAVRFNVPWHSDLSPLVRDHRKILVVDHTLAFCGGMNMTAEYAGPVLGTNRFRDTHVLLEGPGVADLGQLFVGSFQMATGERLAVGPRPAPMPRGVQVQVLGSNQRGGKRHIQRALFHTLGRAVKTCALTSPYFVPPPRLLRQLVSAARRGVAVRILTAGLTDVPAARVAAEHIYGTLLRAGVQIFEMNARTLHAKTSTIDGVYCSVGSFNLDRWSYGRNLEVTVACMNGDVAAALQRCFEADLVNAREVKLAEWEARGTWRRVLGYLAFQLMRV